MTANRIAKRLWLGSFPDECPPGVDLVVLCAEELQNYAGEYKCKVMRVPLDDAKPTQREVALAINAASGVNHALRRGKRVLVTCAMGVNRSALVVALSLMQRGLSAQQAIDLIRAKRKPGGNWVPLSNKHFVEVLHSHGRVRKAMLGRAALAR